MRALIGRESSRLDGMRNECGGDRSVRRIHGDRAVENAPQRFEPIVAVAATRCERCRQQCGDCDRRRCRECRCHCRRFDNARAAHLKGLLQSGGGGCDHNRRLSDERRTKSRSFRKASRRRPQIAIIVDDDDDDDDDDSGGGGGDGNKSARLPRDVERRVRLRISNCFFIFSSNNRSFSGDIGRAIVRDMVRVGAQKSIAVPRKLTSKTSGGGDSDAAAATAAANSTSTSFHRLLASLRRRFQERRRSSDVDETHTNVVDAFRELEPVFEWAENRIVSREDEDSGGTLKVDDPAAVVEAAELQQAAAAAAAAADAQTPMSTFQTRETRRDELLTQAIDRYATAACDGVDHATSHQHHDGGDDEAIEMSALTSCAASNSSDRTASSGCSIDSTSINSSSGTTHAESSIGANLSM